MLRELRKKKKMTLIAVSEILGISAMQLSRIERGMGNLKVTYAKKLGALYGVDWVTFFN